MSQLTADRVTNEYKGREIELTAGGTIYAGGLIAMDSNGKAVAATTSGNDVIGVALNGATSGDAVRVVRKGVFGFANGTGDGVALTAANIGGYCYVGDDQTVNATAKTGSTDNAKAGRVFGFDGTSVLVQL